MIEIFPIRTKEDYEKALYVLEHAQVGNKEHEERIEILAQLVELWEKKHFAPLPKQEPGDVLREIMLTKRVSQGEISRLLSTPQTNVSAMITGKRKLNADQVTLLCAYFRLTPEVFGDVKKARYKVLKLNSKKPTESASSPRQNP